ncbi:CapA family protein [Nocardioides nanhaiensis]|uniref:CapA family protein n=1 Tax=Nocardioides nanhaiensis TaxID=1476871 RepID=UPI0031EE4850
MRRRHASGALLAGALVVALLVLTSGADRSDRGGADDRSQGRGSESNGSLANPVPGEDPPPGEVTLSFAGDVHFEGAFVDYPERGGSTLGEMSQGLRWADVALVNLESALIDPRNVPEPASKELEDPSLRYWFGTSPAALRTLARSGVDVASISNNHGADYGARGLRQTLAARRTSPIALVGVGASPREAYTPYRTTVRNTDVAVFSADASPRESVDPTWEVTAGRGPGLAAARPGEAGPLLRAVRTSAQRDDVTVVYVHWGEEGSSCPTGWQQQLASSLAEAGADVVVGSHAHRLQGAGMIGDTYVAYGLGDFFWYHGRRPESGVLTLRWRDGQVVDDELQPAARTPEGGAPLRVTGAERQQARRDWRQLRGCTGLAPAPGERAARAPSEPEEPEATEAPTTPAPTEQPDTPAAAPPFQARVKPISPQLQRRMTGVSHRPAVCPVGFDDLRLVVVPHVDFEGEVRTGRVVVNADVVDDVVGIMRELYRARWPIERMVLVDVYGGDDNRSMAANNSSGYNCRPVAGSTSWSQHAYGRALDLNPVQNPYVLGGEVLPPAGDRFARMDRSGPRPPAPGVIVPGDVVTRAFERRGWRWGAYFGEPDYQHFDRG